MSHYKHIMWDFNGTILDDLELCLDIQAYMLKELRLPPISRELYLDTFSFPIKDWYERIGYDVSNYESIAGVWAEIYAQKSCECALTPGFLALSGEFERHNARQSILSACWQEQLDTLVDGLHISRLFSEVQGANSIFGESKERLGVALAVRSGIAPDSTLFIGDTLHDMQTARAIGCDCALVAVGHQSLRRLRAEWSDVFCSFDELLGALSDSASTDNCAKRPRGNAG